MARPVVRYAKCGHVGFTVHGKNVQAFVRVVQIKVSAVIHEPGYCPDCKKRGEE